MKKTIIISTVAFLIPMMVSAQALPFITADYDPATLATGGASAVQTSSIAYAAFRNAATIPFSEQKADVAASYAGWAPGGCSTNVITIAGAINMNKKLGFTAGLAYGMNPAYEITDDSGTSNGSFKPNEMQLNAGFSYRFLPFLSAGVNVGYASTKLAENASCGAFNADIFLMAKFGGLKVTAGVSDIGSAVTSTSGASYSLPAAATLGVGFQTTAAEKHDFEVSADADYYLAGAFAGAFGLAYVYNDLVSVRAGYRYGGKSVIPSFASVGAGIKLMGIKLNAAYLIGSKESPMANTIAVGLGYTF